MKKENNHGDLSNFEGTLSYIFFTVPENKQRIDDSKTKDELLNVCESIVDKNMDKINDKKKAVELLTNISGKRDLTSALMYLYNFYLKGDNLSVIYKKEKSNVKQKSNREK